MCCLVCRDQIGKTRTELVATKELYVSVCKVKDELEDKVRDLQAENTRIKVHGVYLGDAILPASLV